MVIHLILRSPSVMQHGFLCSPDMFRSYIKDVLINVPDFGSRMIQTWDNEVSKTVSHTDTSFKLIQTPISRCADEYLTIMIKAMQGGICMFGGGSV